MPVTRAQTVELYPAVFLSADVFRHHIELSDGNIEHVALGVIYFYVVLDYSVGVDFADTAENSYAVGAVNHVISGGELGQAVNALSFLFALLLSLRTVSRLTVGNQEEFFGGQLKSGAERAAHNINNTLFAARKVFGDLGAVAVGLQVLRQILGGFVGARHNHAAALRRVKSAQILG